MGALGNLVSFTDSERLGGGLWGAYRGTLLLFITHRRCHITFFQLEQTLEPSGELVASVHARYCAAVVSIFDRHKKEFGYADDEELVIE